MDRENMGKILLFLIGEFFVYRPFLYRDYAKLLIELWEKYFFQKDISFFRSIDSSQSHLFDQPVLKGLKQSFNTSFRLWGISKYHCYSQCFHSSLELRLELTVIQCTFVVNFVGRETIQIDTDRLSQSCVFNISFPKGKYRDYSFMHRKLCLGNLPGSIIN